MWWLWTNPFVPFNPFAPASDKPAAADSDTQGHMMTLAQHGAQACCMWSQPDGFYHFSPNWIRIAGLSADDSMGQAFFESLHPDSRDAFTGGIASLFSNDPIERIDTYSMEAQIMRGDGYWGWAELTLVPVRSRDETRTVSILASDITEQVQLRHGLEAARRESDVATMGRASFLSNMSHELRTPLNAILGFAQMLEIKYGSSDVQTSDYIRLIRQSGQELLTKISDLIELSNIDSNTAKIHEEPMNLMDIIDAAIEMHSHAAFSKDVRILKEINLSQVVLHGDRTKLIHILSHLIANAVRHSESHDFITIRAQVSKESGINISILDRGCGITKPHLGAIKEALSAEQSYYSTDIGSVRLGLSVAKEFTELHGGRLSIESVAHQGTVATLTLPPSRIVSLSARVKTKERAAAKATA